MSCCAFRAAAESPSHGGADRNFSVIENTGEVSVALSRGRGSKLSLMQEAVVTIMSPSHGGADRNDEHGAMLLLKLGRPLTGARIETNS